MSIFKYLLVILAFFFAACEKPVEYKNLPFQNQANLIVEKTGVNVFRLSMSIDTAAWNIDDLKGILIYNLYRINSSGKTLITRKLFRSPDVSFSAGYKYVNEFGKTDTLLYDSLLYYSDSVGDRNNTWIKYAVAVQYGVKKENNYLFSGGYEGALVIVDARDARPVFRLDINDKAVSTVTPFVKFSGYFDTVGVDTLKVYRFSAIRSVDSVGSWIPRIDSSSANSLIFLRGNSVSFLSGDATPVVKKVDGSIHFIFPNTDLPGNYDSTLYGNIGRVDRVPKTQWNFYFDSLTYDNDGTAFFSKNDTLIEGLGRKIILLVPASVDSTTSLWAPMSDEILIKDYIGNILVDVDQMGSQVGIDNVNNLAYVFSNDIKFKFNAYGDSSFIDQDLYVWLVTRNVCSRVFSHNLANRTFTLDNSSIPFAGDSVPFLDGTKGLVLDALLETEPVKFSIGSSTIIRSSLNVNDSANYRVSPFKATYTSRVITSKMDTATNTLKYDTTYPVQAKEMKDLIYYENPTILARVIKPGSFLGYAEDDLNKFSAGGFVGYGSSNSLSKIELFGTNANDNKIFKTAGWYRINPSVASFNALPDSWKNNFPTFLKSYQKKEYYHNPLTNVPSQMLSQYFSSLAGSKFIRGKEFILVAFCRGRYFKEPRVFVSAFNAPLTYVWDKTPPHFSWTPNHSPLINKIYAPMYYNAGAASGSKITNLSALNNIFDVHLTINDANEGIVSGLRDMGYGKISSVRLMFHYKTDAFSENPITGQRTYLDGSEPTSYTIPSGELAAVGSMASTVSFKGIDARNWRKGFWDMWIESADDLGNAGVAPFGGNNKLDLPSGNVGIRTIEIK